MEEAIAACSKLSLDQGELPLPDNYCIQMVLHGQWRREGWVYIGTGQPFPISPPPNDTQMTPPEPSSAAPSPDADATKKKKKKKPKKPPPPPPPPPTKHPKKSAPPPSPPTAPPSPPPLPPPSPPILHPSPPPPEPPPPPPPVKRPPPPPAPVPVPTPTGIAQGPGTAINIATILSVHNADRAAHSAPAMVWNASAAAFAASYTAGCPGGGTSLIHSGNPNFGENLALWYPPSFWTASDAIQAWYNEGSLYNYNDPGFSDATGHFTQVVWVGSTSVGCASELCAGAVLFSCNYWPPGNYLGEFQQNVLAS